MGVDDPHASLRMDINPRGLHAQVLSPNGNYYVDPVYKHDATVHASYRKKQLPQKTFACGFTGQPIRSRAQSSGGGLQAPTGGGAGVTLKTYRIAVAAQGEYTQFYGGTVAQALAGIVTTINRVTGIYERDVAVRFQLVANNNLIIYTNPATDPYAVNDSTSAMLDQNQITLDSVIGSANYDIGHVVNTGGGGLASLGVVCFNPAKARGSTGLAFPRGDPFDVDFVAHEIGHQCGAEHTFNGANCAAGARNASTAFERGGGTTIMAYAGLCGPDNLTLFSSDYFHASSISEITAYLNSEFCEVSTATGNSSPSVNAGSNYTIPRSTPFTLTASGSDPDGDSLTYCWEEMDLGPAQALTAPDNGSSPLFRSFPPTASPSRTLPHISNILANTNSTAEVLPSLGRTMTWRVTARDNRLNGGGTDSDDTTITVAGGAGPFLVTYPNTAVSVSGTQTVTWNTANTQNSPVNASLVNILLSLDSGNTFPIVLAENVANDGSQSVDFPNLNASNAQIKIQPVNNIFFDLSNVDFTITGLSGVPFFIESSVSVNDAFGNGNGNGGADPGESNLWLYIAVENDSVYNATAVSGVLTSATSTATVTADTSAYPNVNAGQLGTNMVPFGISLDADHICGEPVSLLLIMSSAESTNSVFLSVPTGGVLAPQTLSYSPSQSVPDGSTVDIPFTVGASGRIDDVDFRFDGVVCTTDPSSSLVGLNHPWVGDLLISLFSPAGTEVVLMNTPGGGTFGSEGNNFCQTRLNDDGAFTSIQNINVNGFDQPHTGSWKPMMPLSAFDGEEAGGTWTLRVTDQVAPDNGRVNSFSLILTLRNCAAPTTNVVYTLTATGGMHGTVSPEGAVMVTSSTDTNFVITADTYFHIEEILTNGAAFSGLPAGDPENYVFIWSNVLENGTLNVSFAPNLATNFTPEWWLAMFGLTNGGFDAAALADVDGDGVPAWEEHKAATNPTNASSFLQVHIQEDDVISWSSESNKFYTLRYGETPLSPPVLTQINIPATPPMNVWTNSSAIFDSGFYSIEVQP